MQKYGLISWLKKKREKKRRRRPEKMALEEAVKLHKKDFEKEAKKFQFLGITEKTGRPKAEIDEQELLRLREKGFSYREIAERLNISCSTAFKRLKELEKQGRKRY